MGLKEKCLKIDELVGEVAGLTLTEGGSFHRRCSECFADVTSREEYRDENNRVARFQLDIQGLNNCKSIQSE